MDGGPRASTGIVSQSIATRITTTTWHMCCMVTCLHSGHGGALGLENVGHEAPATTELRLRSLQREEKGGFVRTRRVVQRVGCALLCGGGIAAGVACAVIVNEGRCCGQGARSRSWCCGG